MKSLHRLFLTLGALVVIAGCAAHQGAALPQSAPAAESGTAAVTKADPRTMSFPPLSFRIPKSERVQLANGMVVYLLQDHELPIVNLTAYLNAGSIYEPADKIGLASLTGAVLRSGGTQLTPPDQLDRELEFMASSLESSINSDHASVSLSTLTKNLDRTLALFAELMTKPAFDKGRVELSRSHALEGIRRQNDDPKGIAGRELNRAIYA